MSQEILDFLEGHGVDHIGRKVNEILAFSHSKIEEDHEFIQWLFPLIERSLMVPSSPVMDESFVPLVKSSPKALQALEDGLLFMSEFYHSTDHWLAPGDHNLFRITRILKSTCLLVRPSSAISFLTKILKRFAACKKEVPPESLRFWQSAVQFDWEPKTALPSKDRDRATSALLRRKVREARLAYDERTKNILKTYDGINRSNLGTKFDKPEGASDDQSGSDARRKPLKWS